MITRKIRHWSLVSQFILTLSKENQESRKYDQTTIILEEVSNSFQLYIYVVHTIGWFLVPGFCHSRKSELSGGLG